MRDAVLPLDPEAAYAIANQKLSFTRVTIKEKKVQKERRGTRFSRTHLPLDPHTDSTYRTNPHDVVAFQCIVPDGSGGDTSALEEQTPEGLPREASPQEALARALMTYSGGSPDRLGIHGAMLVAYDPYSGLRSFTMTVDTIRKSLSGG